MSKWKDDGDYLTQKYVTHDKNPMKVIVSIKKTAIFDDKSNQSNLGKQDIKSGAYNV